MFAWSRNSSRRGGKPLCRRWIASLLTVISAVLVALAPPASEAASRHAAMAIDANTGQVLFSQSGDEQRYPASLTKMMTIYLVFDLMEQGRLKANTRIRISPNAAGTAPSKLGLEAGAEITVMDAVQALIVKSANDMAVAVAEHIAGSEAKFAALMTQRARQLGMAHTTFRNAHGLPDSAQVTTARDMLTLAMRLHDDFPQHYRLFALRSFTYNGVTHRNHNTMLSTYRGMDGLKTGYTGPAGFNLVASVNRDGRHVVAAVFGGSSAAARNAYMRVLLDRSLAKASPEKTRKPAPVARAPRTEPKLAARKTDAKLLEPVKLIEPGQGTPAPVAAVPAPKPAPPREARIARPAPAAPAPVAPTPVAAAAPAAPIEIQRVRPVVVAPRPRRGVEVAAAPTTPADVAPDAAPVARGAPPSSLQAQAERLARGEPPAPVAVVRPPTAPVAAAPSPAYRLNGPAAAPTRSASVTIQVGAYATEGEAQRQLQLVRSKVADLLDGARPVTMPVTNGGRQLFRARFSGLEAAQASKACLELRRQQVDCLVTPDG